MPLFEYLLLALIGSSGVAGTTPTTLGPEAITQPNGGALSALQDPPKKDDIRRTKTMLKQRRHHKHRHGRRLEYSKDKKGSKNY